MKINGQTSNIKTPIPLSELLKKSIDEDQCFAVAVNKVFVPKKDYQNTVIDKVDEIDIVTPSAGG